MNAKVDMDECEKRNRWGFHRIAAGRDNTLIGAGGMLLVDSSRLLPLIMLSCFLAGGALLSTVMVAWLLPPRIAAEMRSELAQDVAEARAEAKYAGTDAAIWKNRVMKLEAQADARH